MRASVLINNYNYGRYLKSCVESVLNQTYDAIELIIYDDGSTDESLAVLQEYKGCIQVITDSNYGKTPNLNQMHAVHRAFEKSTGDVILLLDSDDFFKLDKVEKIIGMFKSNPSIGVIQHPLEVVNTNEETTGRIEPVLKEVEDPIQTIYATSNIFHYFSMTSGLAFRRSFLEKHLPLKEDSYSKICVDARLMLIAAFDTAIATICSPLAYYRRHGENEWGNIGAPDVHTKYTEELYLFFNSLARDRKKPEIRYSQKNFLENTFFYDQVDRGKCSRFLYKDSKKAFLIWGAGEAGQSVFHALSDYKTNFKGFIDSDERKQRETVSGYLVTSFEEILSLNESKIFISPYHAYEEIAHQLDKLGYKEGEQFISPYKI